MDFSCPTPIVYADDQSTATVTGNGTVAVELGGDTYFRYGPGLYRTKRDASGACKYLSRFAAPNEGNGDHDGRAFTIGA